jgi:hypothetical protein
VGSHLDSYPEDRGVTNDLSIVLLVRLGQEMDSGGKFENGHGH